MYTYMYKEFVLITVDLKFDFIIGQDKVYMNCKSEQKIHYVDLTNIPNVYMQSDIHTMYTYSLVSASDADLFCTYFWPHFRILKVVI